MVKVYNKTTFHVYPKEQKLNSISRKDPEINFSVIENKLKTFIFILINFLKKRILNVFVKVNLIKFLTEIILHWLISIIELSKFISMFKQRLQYLNNNIYFSLQLQCKFIKLQN